MASDVGGQVAVGPTATLLVGAGVARARLFNMGSSRVFYGDRTVDDTGNPLLPGQAVDVTVGLHGIYGVAFAPPSVTVAWSEL